MTVLKTLSFNGYKLADLWNISGAFAKSDYLALSCLSVRVEQPCSPLNGFSWNLIFFFRKSFEKTQVALKSYKNNWYFTWRRFHVSWQYIAEFVSECEMFQIKVIRENQNTDFVFSTFFSQVIVPWISKATNTHSYVTPTGFVLQQWLRERASVWYIVGLVLI